MSILVCNHLTIEGKNPVKIMHFILAESDESDCGFDVDFNNVCPLPKELTITERTTARNYAKLYVNSLSKNGGEYKKQAALYEKAFTESPVMSSTEQQQEMKFALLHWNYECNHRYFESTADVYACGRRVLKNYALYGATNVQDWCEDNWGTKENACHTQINDMNEADIYFDTVDSEAIAFIVALSQKYPKYTFHFEHAANVPGYTAGSFSFKNGAIIAGWPYTDESKEAYETYFALWGGEDEYRFNITTGTYESIEEEISL